MKLPKQFKIFALQDIVGQRLIWRYFVVEHDSHHFDRLAEASSGTTTLYKVYSGQYRGASTSWWQVQRELIFWKYV